MSDNSKKTPCGWSARWTKEEDEVLINYYTDKTIEELLLMLPNRTTKAIYGRAYKLGLKYRVYDEDFFEIIDSEEKAYWLGFLYADGYVVRDGRWGVELSIKDINHLEKLNRSLKSNISIRTRERKVNEILGVSVEKKASCSIQIKNPKMYGDLVNKGVIPNKTHHLSFPSCDIVPLNLMRHFIRGLFDGDGSFSIRTSSSKYKDKVYYGKAVEVSFVCKSEEFNVMLMNFIEELADVKFLLRYNPKGNLPTLRLSRKKDVLRFFDFIYSDSTIYLDRKYEKSQEIINCLTQ